MEAGGAYAEFAAFPPFYTLQPVEATREKQLTIWRAAVLDWFAKRPEAKALTLDTFELFENGAINRKMNGEGRRAVAQDLIASGHGQWQEEGKTLRVFVRTPADWASKLLEFVHQNGLSGAIYTLYELHSGDLTRDTQMHGMDPALCLEAVQVLARQGKAQVFAGAESVDETGVKFL